MAAAQGRNVVLDPADCRAILADLAELKRLHAAGQPSTTPDAELADAVEGVSLGLVLRRVADATKEPRVAVVDQPKAAELVRLLDAATGKVGAR